MPEEAPQYITPEIDKRQHRRARLVTKVHCESLGRQELLLTRDVSTGGVFVSAQDPFPINTVVAISLQLPAGGPTIHAKGNTVYSMKGLGMGVQFVDIGEESLAALQKFVDESA